MAVCCIFFKLEAHQTALIVSSLLPHPNQQVQIKKQKVRQLPFLSAAGCHSENIYDIFSRVEKPSEDRTWRLFLINMKGF
jgi:hypothetical protein